MAPGSTGVTARTEPTSESGGQLRGLAANVAGRHAFCSVVSREGSCNGSCETTEWMLAWWPGWTRSTLSATPLTREADRRLVSEANVGEKGRLLQPVTWNWLDAGPENGSVEVRADSVASMLQLVGFSRKWERLTLTLSVRSRSGTPLTTVGRLLVAITRALAGSTPTDSRVTTRPA